MKLNQLFAATSFALLGSVLGEEPIIPYGFLNASSLMVRAESNVDLTWEVNIPATDVEELVEIPPDEPTIIAKEDVAFEIRMLGAEYAYLGEYVLSYGQYQYDDSPSYTFFLGLWRRPQCADQQNLRYPRNWRRAGIQLSRF